MAWELYSCDLGISACQGLSWLKTHSDLDLDFSHGQTRILPWEYVHAISNQSEVCEELLYLQANDLHLDFKVTIKLLYHKNDIWSFNLDLTKAPAPPYPLVTVLAARTFETLLNSVEHIYHFFILKHILINLHYGKRAEWVCWLLEILQPISRLLGVRAHLEN